MTQVALVGSSAWDSGLDVVGASAHLSFQRHRSPWLVRPPGKPGLWVGTSAQVSGGSPPPFRSGFAGVLTMTCEIAKVVVRCVVASSTW